MYMRRAIRRRCAFMIYACALNHVIIALSIQPHQFVMGAKERPEGVARSRTIIQPHLYLLIEWEKGHLEVATQIE
jgi:hypothetical protein